MEAVQIVPERVVPGGWVLGGVSPLLDVWSPSPLIMWAPGFRYPEHELRYEIGEGSSRPMIKNRDRMRVLSRKLGINTLRMADSDLVFDCRYDATGNVAHVLQNQIGVALGALEAMGMSDRWRDVVFIVREGCADHAVALREVLGFRTIETERVVSGNLVRMTPGKFPLRSIAGPVLRRHAEGIGLVSSTDRGGDRIFLARRGRRSLINMHEIEPLLDRAGMRTVYAEDLSAEDQIRTIANAGAVFALHGAAMAYLMFRNPESAASVAEAFSCGYASNWARAICSQTGCAWIGVQGTFDADIVGQNRADFNPRAFESRSYSLDPETVELLLNLYFGFGNPGDADELFERLRERAVIGVGVAQEQDVAP